MFADMAHKLYKEIEEAKFLPLYTVNDFKYLDILEEILIENNCPFIEIAFRNDNAAAAIKKLAASEKLIVGAGTVRTVKEATIAVENGAKFIVSPAIDPEVIEYCIEKKIPVFPGVATPGDIQRASKYGIKVVKFFPADIYGGLKAIQSLSGPFYDVKFLPTGGIDQDNYVDYLNHDHVIAVGGSFIISEKVIKKDNGKTASKILKFLVKNAG